MKKKIAIALLGLGLAATSHAGTIWSVNGHEYQVVSNQGQISWTAARTAAQALGAGWDLATVGSAGENSFIIGLLGSHGADVYRAWWLGAAENIQTSTWSWIDGTPWTFTSWYPGEPNNYLGAEDYLEILWHGPTNQFGWNDAPLGGYANWTYGYVAERVPVGNGNVPEPGTLMLLGLGLFGLAALRSKTVC